MNNKCSTMLAHTDFYLNGSELFYLEMKFCTHATLENNGHLSCWDGLVVFGDVFEKQLSVCSQNEMCLVSTLVNYAAMFSEIAERDAEVNVSIEE